MFQMDGAWCISFMAAILVVLLFAAILTLIVWNVVANIKSEFFGLIKSLFQLGEYFVDTLKAIVAYIVNHGPQEKKALEEALAKLSAAIAAIFAQIKQDQLLALLESKIEAYANAAIEDLKKINAQIANLFTKLDPVKSQIEKILNDIDAALIKGESDVVKLRGYAYNFIMGISKAPHA